MFFFCRPRGGLAIADTSYWFGGSAGANNEWTAAANWFPASVPNSTTTASFSYQPNLTINVHGSASAEGLNFNYSGYTLNVLGQLNIGAGGIQRTTSDNNFAPKVAVGGSGTMVLGGNAEVYSLSSLGGTIIGASGTSVNLTILGNENATYQGGLFNGSFGSMSLTIGDGVNAASQTIIKTTSFGLTSYTGTTRVNPNATLTIQSFTSQSPFIVNGTLNLVQTNYLPSLSGTGTINGPVSSSSSENLGLGSGTFDGKITGDMAVTVSVGTVTLTGSNSFSRGVQVYLGGRLNFLSDASLGASGATALIQSGAVFHNMADVTSARNYYIGSGTATFELGSGYLTIGQVSGRQAPQSLLSRFFGLRSPLGGFPKDS